MIITKMSLPRRTFLRGMGATLALPLLDAMVPALTAAAKTPAAGVRRLGVVYVPNGMAMDTWTPATDGAGFAMTPILEPLAPFRDRMLVLSGLNVQPGNGTHLGASTRFLTGTPGRATPGGGVRAGTSVDQLAAREFAQHTQIGSLELGLDTNEETGVCDGNSTPCALATTISWRTPTMYLPTENNPGAVFERMFGDVGSTESAARLSHLKTDRSILDSVVASAADLQRGLGPGDRTKVDEYLESVRDIERRIQKAEEQSATELPVVARPIGIPATFEEHAKLMFDLQVLAYQSDLTRVITFMLGREFSGRTYPEIGIPEAHHPLSHHQYDPERLALLSRLNTHHVSTFAYYLSKLRATADGDGSLLDHMLLIYGAGMGDSNAHSVFNIPILLMGGPDVVGRGGRHITYPGLPASNLLVTVMDKLGLPMEPIGNASGELNVQPLSGV
jgi:hypothetical protein